MIISTDIKEPLDTLIAKITNSPKNIQSVFTLHGSSSQLNKPFFVSDIDMEYWMRYTNNTKDLIEECKRVFRIFSDEKMYFVKMISGVDERFVFNSKIRKNGLIEDYDPSEIKKRFEKLYKDNIITKQEKDNLLEYVIDEPRLIEYMKFNLVLDSFKNIIWTIDEINQGYKKYRGIRYDLYKDIFMKDIFRITVIYEILEKKYVLMECIFHIFTLPSSIKTIPKENQYRFLTDNATLCGEKQRNTTDFYYESIFRNYIRENYLKMLKRLRSLLTEVFFRRKESVENNNINKDLKDPRYKKLLFNVRKDIHTFTKSSVISCLNQVKNTIEIINILSPIIKKKELQNLIIRVLDDVTNTCDYNSEYIDIIKKSILNDSKDMIQEKLQTFHGIIFNRINELSIEPLKQFTKRIEFLLPYRLEIPIPK